MIGNRFTGRPGQWWNAPVDQIKHAYYRLLREVYGYPALEAWQTTNKNFERYPEFMHNPITTLRKAVRGDQQ